MMEDIQTMCPTEDELCNQESGINVPCPVTGCGKILPQRTNLRIHLLKVHKINPSGHNQGAVEKTVKKAKVQYHCPREGCVYNPSSPRHFTSMKNLKQHYMHVHAEKKFKCSSCGQGFGLEGTLRRHSQSCGRIFRCEVCSCPYSTREALLTHCSRKMHPVPEIYKCPSSLARPIPVIVQAPAVTPPASCPQTSTNLMTSSTLVAEADDGQTNTDKEDTAKSLPGGLDKDKHLTTSGIPSLISQTVLTPTQPVRPKTIAPKPNMIVINLLPQPAAPNIIYISDASRHPSSVNKSRNIAPKPDTTSGLSVRKATDTGVPSGESTQSSTVGLSFLKKTTEVQTESLSPSKVRHRNSRRSAAKTTMSTQTHSSVHRRNVAQTQTTGDFILKQAMESASIPIRKESKGSQVSPRAKLKRAYRNVQSSQTQTVTSPRATRKKRRRKSGTQTSTIMAPPRSLTFGPVTSVSSASISSVLNPVETVDSFADFTSDPSASLSNNETQTLLEELEAFGESISTQTLESFLADGEADADAGGQRQNSGAQTHCSLTSNQLDDLQTVDQSVLCDLDFGESLSCPTSSVGLFDDTINPASFDSVVPMPTTSTVLTPSSSSSYSILSTVTSTKAQQTSEFSLQFPGPDSDIGSTAETQTCTSDLDLSSLLNTSSSQTSEFTGYMNTETQTGGEEDGMLQDFFNNMQTQTNDEYMTDLSFSDIETQTSSYVMSSLDIMDEVTEKSSALSGVTDSSSSLDIIDSRTSGLQPPTEFSSKRRPTFATSTASTVVAPHTSAAIQADLPFSMPRSLNNSYVVELGSSESPSASSTVETQTSMPSLPVNEGTDTAPSSDIETQTLFSEVDLGPDLTDSHTQTSLHDLMSLVKGLQ